MEKKIRVAFFSHDAHLKTGGNLSLLSLLEGITKLGIACFVFLPAEGEFSAALTKRHIPFTVVPNFFWITGYTEGESNLRIKARLLKKIFQRIPFFFKHLPKYIKVLKAWKPDIVYTNTTAIFDGAIISFMLNKPHIWHVRELKGFEFKYDFGNAIFRFFLKRASAQIFVSKALKNALYSYYTPFKAYVVYNGIDIPKEQNDTKQQETFTFSMVGRLQARKKPDIAIEAVACLKDKYPHIRLLLAGGAAENYLTYLKNLVSKYGLGNHVIFLGEVTNPFEKVYRQSDAYLMCSVNETFGRVTVEAMMAHLPVIGYKSKITGTKEIVEDSVTGLLYEGGAKELAKCMQKLILNPMWAEDLGKKGYERAITNFSIDAYTKNIYNIIQKQVRLA